MSNSNATNPASNKRLTLAELDEIVRIINQYNLKNEDRDFICGPICRKLTEERMFLRVPTLRGIAKDFQKEHPDMPLPELLKSVDAEQVAKTAC